VQLGDGCPQLAEKFAKTLAKFLAEITKTINKSSIYKVS
jgi:hypothetical protein